MGGTWWPSLEQGDPALGLVHSAPRGGFLHVVTGNPWQLPPVGGKSVGG